MTTPTVGEGMSDAPVTARRSDTFGTGAVPRLSRRLAGAGAALTVVWPLLPVLSRYNVAAALVYVAAALLLVGVPVSYPLEHLASSTRIPTPRLTVYALAGAVSGGLVGGAFLMPGLVLIGAALGVYLAVAAAWSGPRFPLPLGYLAAANTLAVGAVGLIVG
jgi:hypothetical protein